MFRSTTELEGGYKDFELAKLGYYGKNFASPLGLDYSKRILFVGAKDIPFLVYELFF